MRKTAMRTLPAIIQAVTSLVDSVLSSQFRFVDVLANASLMARTNTSILYIKVKFSPSLSTSALSPLPCSPDTFQQFYVLHRPKLQHTGSVNKYRPEFGAVSVVHSAPNFREKRTPVRKETHGVSHAKCVARHK
jgi:hypothetical protein